MKRLFTLTLTLILLLSSFAVVASSAKSNESSFTMDMNTHYATLRNETVSAEIDLSSGCVRSLSKEGLAVFRQIDEELHIFYADDGNIRLRLSDCSVTDVQDTPQGLLLTLANDRLSSASLSLQVLYFLQNDRLCRKISIKNEGFDLWFAESKVHVELEDNYRQDGFYYLPWPSGNPLIAANDIQMDIQFPSVIYGPHSTAMVGFYQGKSNLTAVSTLVAQNDSFAGTSFTQRHNLDESQNWITEQPTLTKNGWSHRTNRMALQPYESYSYEVDFYVTKGDTTEFFSAYLQNDYLKAAAVGNWVDETSPVRNIKYTQYILPGYSWLNTGNPQNKTFFDSLNKSTSEYLKDGQVMTLVNFYGWTGGTHPSNADTTTMKAGTKWLQSKNKHVLIGQFDFSALVPNYSGKGTDLFAQHPDWAINGSSTAKSFAQWYPAEGTYYPEGRYTLQYALPDVQKYIESCAQAIVNDTAPQFVYLEDKESAFAPDFDYENGLVFTDADNRKALELYRDALHKGNAFLWINDPDSVVGDMVQLEMASGVWQPGSETWSNWRAVSDALYLAKARQDAYGAGAVNLIYPYEYDRYFSYILAYSAIPNFAPDSSATLTDKITPLIPFMDARYEIRNGQVVDGKAELTPSWRKDANVQTDVVGLTIGDNSGIMTAIHNAPDTVIETISGKADALHVDSNKTVFLWQLSMTNPGNSFSGFSQPTSTRPLADRTDSCAPAVVTDKLQVLKAEELKDGRIGAELTLAPYMAKMLSATNVPAFIENVDGYSVQYKLSETLGVKLSGDCPENGNYEVKATSEKEAVIAVYLRENDLDVYVDGTLAIKDTFTVDGHTFTRLSITEGDHTIRIGTAPTDVQPETSNHGLTLTQTLILCVTAVLSATIGGILGAVIPRFKMKH